VPAGSDEPEPVPEQTWDGLPVAGDPPHGSAIVVRRPAPDDRAAADDDPGGEYLLLHRARRGPGYDGDWAWTSPSGARLPGEPVLSGARRELAEETGIEAAELRPCDLSGAWAVFVTDVPPGTPVRLDAEHDSWAWLPAGQAAGRLLPGYVAADFRRAAAIPPSRITFRPLAAADLPDLLGWMRAPHAARWFAGNPDLAQLRRKYLPRIEDSSPVRVHIALIDGLAAGFLQHYPAPASPQAVGLDYVIGVEELAGRGLGAQLIWSYLVEIALPAHPDATCVVAAPEVANHRSIRALEKAGFRRSAQVAGETPDRPELLCILDRQRIFG
jgi:8-oxo-dGTP pyrophosphatase MutT (NUDIX family)/RimJ/RimL family protein N-acetyltransferase